MCEPLQKRDTDLILNKSMYIYMDSLIAINSLSLATFPVYSNAMNKGKEAKLKLFVANKESVHIDLLRIKFVLHICRCSHT